MKNQNQNKNTETGYWIYKTVIKPDATPINNITKFAYYDSDYEEVKEWHEYTQEELAHLDNEQKKQVINDNLPNIIDTLENGIAELGDLIGDIVYSQKEKGGQNGKK